MANISNPLVSIVVPVYNGARFIAPTLRSALMQTYSNIEVIVVDDGSTDETPAIIERLAARDPRLKLCHQANCGVAAARNHGIRESNGAFIAPLDGDDIWHPEKIEKQLRRFQASGPDVGLVYCWTQRIDEAGRILPREIIDYAIEGHCLADVITLNPVGHASGALVRRAAMEAVGGFSEALRDAGAAGCEDHKLYIDIAERYAYAVVPEILVGYRRVDSGMSRDIAKIRHSSLVLMDWTRARHPELPERVFRRTITRATFWLITDSTAPYSTLRNLGLMATTLLRDPLFMTGTWFLGWLKRLVFRRIGHLARWMGLISATPKKRVFPLYQPACYEDEDDASGRPTRVGQDLATAI